MYSYCSFNITLLKHSQCICVSLKNWWCSNALICDHKSGTNMDARAVRRYGLSPMSNLIDEVKTKV